MDIADCFIIARITTRAKMILGSQYYKTDVEAKRMLKHVRKGDAKYLVLYIDDFNYAPEYKGLTLITDAPEIPELPTSRRDVQEGIRYTKGNPANRTKAKPSEEEMKSELRRCNRERDDFAEVAKKAAELVEDIVTDKNQCLPQNKKQSAGNILQISKKMKQAKDDTDIKQCEKNKVFAKETARAVIGDASRRVNEYGNEPCQPEHVDFYIKDIVKIKDDYSEVEGLRAKASGDVGGLNPEFCSKEENCFHVVLFTRNDKGKEIEYSKKKVGTTYKTMQSAKRDADFLAKNFKGNERVAVIVLTTEEFGSGDWVSIAKQRAGWR